MATLRNRIWSELTQSKHNVEFASAYSDGQRSRIRFFNLVILVFSTGGIMGWKIWDSLPLVACVIIASASLLRLIQPQLIMDDKLLKKLDDVHRFYVDYFNQLEQLWLDFEADRISNEDAQTRFYNLKNLESDINSIVSEVIRNKPKRIVKKCKVNSDTYFKQIFNA